MEQDKPKDPIKVVIIGAGPEAKTAALLIEMQKQYGYDVMLLTEAEAIELKIPIPQPYTLTRHPVFEAKLRDALPYNHKEECKKGWRK